MKPSASKPINWSRKTSPGRHVPGSQTHVSIWLGTKGPRSFQVLTEMPPEAETGTFCIQSKGSPIEPQQHPCQHQAYLGHVIALPPSNTAHSHMIHIVPTELCKWSFQSLPRISFQRKEALSSDCLQGKGMYRKRQKKKKSKITQRAPENGPL